MMVAPTATLRSVLIANRGEIACRVIRTARARGLRTIAVYSDADKAAPHVALADEAVLIGPGPVEQSYLCSDKIIEAAQRTRADAIHPGYGFLSENADFARTVKAAGLVFIGPPAAAIEAMGDKARAKQLMIAAGVPCVPGYQGADQSEATLIAKAIEIGFPVMIKAAAGGGGRGMRRVDSAEGLAEALALARSEAEAAFGSGALILEKAIIAPRHVEFQIFSDTHGNTIHLGERDCSVQRRHQKVVEEAPCPIMTPQLRARMGQAAIEAARAVDYCGAGTVEFLLDAEGGFYFLEMNTRLQVEHPVTELVTGLDLVALQFAVAEGAPLPLEQDAVRLTGHAIEVRLYAEDPARDYMPVTGHVALWQPAEGPGVRVDAGVASGTSVSPYYDAMLAKIIAHGETREIARARAIKAVEDSVLLGLKTNAGFLADVLSLPAFAAGEATTAILEDAYPDGFSEHAPKPAERALAAALLAREDQRRAFAAAGYLSTNQLGWASAPLPPLEMTVICDGADYTARLRCLSDTWHVEVAGESFEIEFDDARQPMPRAKVGETDIQYRAHQDPDQIEIAIGVRRFCFSRVQPGFAQSDAAKDGDITAPMPGLVREILVVPGARVSKGAPLAVLEAMKMQHPLTAPFDGRVAALHAEPGKQVTAGDLLIKLGPSADDAQSKG